MLAQRALAALVFAPVLLYVVWRGGLALEVACFVLAALMLWEFLQLTLGAGQTYTKGLGFGLGFAVAAAVLGWLPAALAPLLLPMGTLLLFSGVLVRPDPIPQSTTRAALVALAALYGGGLIPYLAVVRALPSGLGLALMALFCTWASDTGAYFAGRFLGRHKLYPKISPSKTVEGGVGGLLSAIGAALLIRLLFDVQLETWQTVAVGAIAAILGAIGDLAESMLKRSVGAKDSSKLIPGHGGVLDRFDGVMFTAPAVYVFVTLTLR